MKDHDRMSGSSPHVPTLGPLFNYADEGMCLIKMVFDEEGEPVDFIFLEVNPNFESHTGLKGVAGKSILELIPDYDADSLITYGRVAEKGEPVKFEKFSEHLGKRWFSINAFPVGSRDSGLVGLVFKDISESKSTEIALEQSEDRFQNLFNSIYEGFCVIKVLFDKHHNAYDYQFIESNPAFTKHTGLIDPVGKTALELVPNLEKHWIETYGRVATTGERIRFEQGSEALGRWFDVEAFSVGNEGYVALLFTDITKRRKAEIALKESEKRFRTFADTAPAPLWVTNAQSKCTFISQEWTEITGMPYEESLGFGWLDAVHPDDFEEIRKDFLEYNRQEVPFRLEYRLRLKSGEYHHVIDAGKPTWDDQGKFSGYVGSIIDIDDRKKVEEALRENEALVNTTMDQLPVGVSVAAAPSGELLFQNEAAKQILGHDKIETKNISGYSRYHALHRDGTPLKYNEYPLAKALKGIVTQQEEVLYRKGDGSLITLIINSAPVHDDKGRIIRGVSTFQDITELRRARESVKLSEAHLKLIMESATDYAIFTMDTDLYITDWNAGAEQIIGYDREEVMGKSGNIIYLDNGGEDKLSNKARIAQTKGKVESEGWYRRKDGSRFYGRGTIMPLRIKGEDYPGYLKILTDYSERREMEEALRRAKEEAEKASNAKDEFLAHMSHEIRTPLNAIIGLSNLLMHKNQEGQLAEDINTIKFSADNLRMLVDDILDFSKIQAGKIDIEHTPLDLRNLLHSLEKAHSLRADEQNNKLVLTITDDVPEIICTDSLRLSQIINNLLSNAIKFTENGHVWLSVRVSAQEDKTAWLDFEVKDTGCGIPADKQSLIFEKFIQADISTVRNYGGTGLGLSITKLLLEIMGSSIHVSSTVGEGSSFYFKLPVEICQPVENRDTDTKGHGEEASGKLRLLIVEDSEINRMVLLQFLELWGEFETDEAINGMEAMNKCAASVYDVILMDVRMPIMDGYQAAQKIKSQKDNANASTPIIALTADTPAELKKNAEANYFDDVITKPFDPEDLRAKIFAHAAKDRVSVPVIALPETYPSSRGFFSKRVTPEPSLHKINELFRGNIEGMKRLIRNTLHDFESLYDEYLLALEQQNPGLMKELLHVRKPMLDLLDLTQVVHRLDSIEVSVSQGVDQAGMEILVEESKTLMRNVIDSVRLKLEKLEES
ncbi:PAS domain S-box protein [Roseivirga sp. BDSF3-8]|uniref:PAS domain S-box protein n=1 Tax=Roseivirga sp. BDSF3-8 TaxID=3241598 RepID=UPI003531C324